MAHRSDGHCSQHRKDKRGTSGDVIWVIQSGRGGRRSGRLVLEGAGNSSGSTKLSTESGAIPCMVFLFSSYEDIKD